MKPASNYIFNQPKAGILNCKKNVLGFPYDGMNEIAEIKGGVTTDFFHGIRQDEIIGFQKGNDQYIYDQDITRSIRKMYATNLEEVKSYTYTPFGKIKNETGDANIDNPLTYTARRYNPTTELAFFKARYYAPNNGQFISEDPMPANVITPQSFNKYAYANNNPYKYWDPTGLTPKFLDDEFFKVEEEFKYNTEHHTGTVYTIPMPDYSSYEYSSSGELMDIRDNFYGNIDYLENIDFVGPELPEGSFVYGNKIINPNLLAIQSSLNLRAKDIGLGVSKLNLDTNSYINTNLRMISSSVKSDINIVTNRQRVESDNSTESPSMLADVAEYIPPGLSMVLAGAESFIASSIGLDRLIKARYANALSPIGKTLSQAIGISKLKYTLAENRLLDIIANANRPGKITSSLVKLKSLKFAKGLSYAGYALAGGMMAYDVYKITCGILNRNEYDIVKYGGDLFANIGGVTLALTGSGGTALVLGGVYFATDYAMNKIEKQTDFFDQAANLWLGYDYDELKPYYTKPK